MKTFFVTFYLLLFIFTITVTSNSYPRSVTIFLIYLFFFCFIYYFFTFLLKWPFVQKWSSVQKRLRAKVFLCILDLFLFSEVLKHSCRNKTNFKLWYKIDILWTRKNFLKVTYRTVICKDISWMVAKLLEIRLGSVWVGSFFSWRAERGSLLKQLNGFIRHKV